MLQAERVTHLVHDHVLDDGLHEGLGLGAVGRQVAARLEHVEREVHLAAGRPGAVACNLRQRWSP